MLRTVLFESARSRRPPRSTHSDCSEELSPTTRSLPNARNGRCLPAPPISSDKTSRPRKRRPAGRERQLSCLTGPSFPLLSSRASGMGKRNIYFPAPQALHRRRRSSKDALQNNRPKDTKTGSLLRRNRKAKNRNEHRHARIGNGRITAKSPVTNPSSSLSPPARTDPTGIRIPSHKNPSDTPHHPPQPLSGNIPRTGPASDRSRPQTLYHPPAPSRYPKRRNTKGHPKIRMPFRGKWGIRTKSEAKRS